MLVDRGGLLVPERDNHCWKAIRFEQQNISHILDFVPSRKVAVQAGGNFGLFPKILSKHFETVYTFEPHPENFQALVINTEGLDNIIKFQAGVGSPRLFSLTEPDPNNFGAFQANGVGHIPCLALDSLPIKECNLLWLDIEGGEYDAIWNARDLISRNHPTIVLEYREHSAAFGHSDKQLHEMVLGLGYHHVATFGADKVYR